MAETTYKMNIFSMLAQAVVRVATMDVISGHRAFVKDPVVESYVGG